MHGSWSNLKKCFVLFEPNNHTVFMPFLTAILNLARCDFNLLIIGSIDLFLVYGSVPFQVERSLVLYK